MKMSNRGYCCDDCFSKIAIRSTASAQLWVDLCEIQADCNLFGLAMKDFPALRILEILGFIVTTETPEIIVVKVLGEHEDDEGVYFCGGNCDE